ncbi:calcium-binding protein [Pseudomonas sp. 22-AL-CL-001]|uniref:calcium-binding protein n=1 Tax=Pseudomonas alabamensis TaxID=3064349 RepID=UPI00271252F5|nr:calcium-binding protein [Pseudomonas sp. 22-AL-CL-001]MDO7910507.1 calcium-binding protein [Pseudomonas sp. 22-AL-CL-001]
MSATADTLAPTLLSLRIPTVVDLGSGKAGLTVSGKASDDKSGIKSIMVSFDKEFAYSHSTNYSYAGNYDFLINSGYDDSWSDGASTQTWFVLPTNASGKYTVTRVKVEDLEGNIRTYTSSELVKLGVNTSVTFKNSTPDTTPPVLKALHIPTVIDLASGYSALTVSGLASDNLAGIKSVFVSFDKEIAYSHSANGAFTGNYSFLNNSGYDDAWSDGASAQTWFVAPTNAAGTYHVTSVKVEDLQGNIRSYTPNELIALGVNTNVTLINSTHDITPPQLKSLTIPTFVDLSAGWTGLTINGTASDDMSGIKSIFISFDKEFLYSHSPSGLYAGKYDFLNNTGFDDSWSDSSSSQTWFIAPVNPTATYNIVSVRVEDLQGNQRVYSSNELTALGINTSILMSAGKKVLTAGNDTFTGTGADDWVEGGAGNDVLKGMGGRDRLDGGDGNDILDGGAGAETMIGGMGNDTYYVDSVDDVVLETSAKGGIDTVISSVTRTLGDYQENLTLSGKAHLNGTGNALANTLTGNDGNNVLNGGAGADTMIGGLGNDTYYVDSANDKVIETSAKGGLDTVVSGVSWTLGDYQENLILSGKAHLNGTGNALANTLTGNDGNNVLNGGAGADTMIGGMGNDTYYVDSANDKVIETSANGGIDTVIASVTRTLGEYQENLTLSGNAHINGTGNALANTLTGNAGNNVLNGGAGADTMIGGMGNDTYYVDSANDKVIETSANGGIDTVIASVTRTLGDYQENLTLSGTSAINGTGNALANTLTGNAANNVLTGGAGNDILIGGAGNDRLVGGLGKDTLTGGTGKDAFVFTSLNDMGLTRATWDVITDFKRGEDKIDLGALDANTATAANEAFHTFIKGTAAFTTAGQLKFQDGVLYGNTDTDSAPEFAIQMVGITSLTASDFVL